MRAGMADSPILAFLSRSESIATLPEAATILPLHPEMCVPSDRLFANRPEDLLAPSDARDIAEATDRIAEGWWQALPEGALLWRGVNLGECFAYDLDLGVRDMLKAACIVDRALDLAKPRTVITDVAPHLGDFPSYPYLSSLGSLLADKGKRGGWHLEAPTAVAKGPEKPAVPVLARAYLSIAARRGLRRIRKGGALVGLGAFPGFYRPVASAWQDAGGAMVVVTSEKAPLRAAPREGLAVVPVRAFLAPEDHAEVARFVDRALGSVRSLPSAMVFRHDGWDLSALVRGHLVTRLEDNLADLTSAGLAFERGLERARRIVIVETGSPLAKGAVRYASRRGIPVTVLQHGILAGAFSYRKTEGDRIAAWGPTDAAWFRSQLGRPVWVEATGCPRYDGLTEGIPGAVPKSLRNLPHGSHAVLYASQPFVQDRADRSPWERHEAFRMALEAVSRSRDLVLLVKRHPAEREETAAALGFDPSRIRAIHGGNTFNLIRRSEVVLAVSSTVSFEAMLLDRPVVFLGAADLSSPFHPPEDGSGVRAHSAAELAARLREILDHAQNRESILRGQRDYLARHYAPLDGRAARRVVEFLRAE